MSQFKNRGSLNCLSALAVVVAFGVINGNSLAAQDATKRGSLTYGAKTDQILSYSVKIEADRGAYTDVLSGTPTYTVKESNQDGITLFFKGGVSQKIKAKPGTRLRRTGPRRGGPFSSPTSVGRSTSSTLTINSRGVIVSTKGSSSQLPYLLGNLSQLMLELLPPTGEEKWQSNRDVVISEAGGRVFGPRFRSSTDKTLTKAKELTTYSIAKSSADSVVVKKSYELKTTATVGGKPKFEITGSGHFTFDVKLGVPKSLEFDQKIIVRNADGTTEIPLKITYNLLSETERTALAEANKNRFEAAKKAIAANKAKQAKPLTDEEVKSIVADLKSDKMAQLRRALFKIIRRSPKTPNPEITAALKALTEHTNVGIRRSAERVLKKWLSGTEKKS